MAAPSVPKLNLVYLNGIPSIVAMLLDTSNISIATRKFEMLRDLCDNKDPKLARIPIDQRVLSACAAILNPHNKKYGDTERKCVSMVLAKISDTQTGSNALLASSNAMRSMASYFVGAVKEEDTQRRCVFIYGNLHNYVANFSALCRLPGVVETLKYIGKKGISARTKGCALFLLARFAQSAANAAFLYHDQGLMDFAIARITKASSADELNAGELLAHGLFLTYAQGVQEHHSRRLCGLMGIREREPCRPSIDILAVSLTKCNRDRNIATLRNKPEDAVDHRDSGPPDLLADEREYADALDSACDEYQVELQGCIAYLDDIVALGIWHETDD